MLPAEWQKQSAVLIAWPHANSYWKDFLDQARKDFSRLIAVISQTQPVVLLKADDDNALSYFQQAAVNLDYLTVVPCATDDTWVRDYGPITVLTEQGPCWLNFTFDAWGNKYSMPKDNQVTRYLLTLPWFSSVISKTMDCVLEGGSIETDGCGTLVTTEPCVLHKRNRAATWDKARMELAMKDWFGVSRVLWLKNGCLVGDDTDGHIDTLVRFTDEHTLCYQGCDDEQDENYQSLLAMEHEIRAWRTINGAPYRLIKLPMPAPCYSQEDRRRLPANYANFLIINDKVLVPTYSVEQDALALDLLAKVFMTRQVVGVDSRSFIENFGSIHCLTMQLPMGVFNERQSTSGVVATAVAE